MLSERFISPHRISPIHCGPCCEMLESRMLLTMLVVNDTANADVITLGVTPAGGVLTIVNGKETDYASGQWDSVFVASTAGSDTINVQATVVPTTVHYIGNVSINVGNAGGVQDIKATLDMNGSVGGPAAGGSAAMFIDDSGDSAARMISLATQGDQEMITGLAPADILIGLVAPPISPAAPLTRDESVSLITGVGNDSLTVHGLRGQLGASINNAGGNDTVNIGDGSLIEIHSPITVSGPSSFLKQPGQTVLNLDSSADAFASAFTLSASYPPGPGPLMRIDYQVSGLIPQSVFYFASGIAAATVNGGPAGNTFTVQDLATRSFPAVTTVTLNTGAGNDKVSVDHTSGSLLVVNGQTGDDAFRTGPIGPFAGVNGNVSFDGGGGNDSLTLQGPLVSPFDIPSSPVFLTAGNAQHFGIDIRYAGVDKLQLQNGAFEVNDNLGLIALVVTSENTGANFESSTQVSLNATQNFTALDLADGPVTLSAGGSKAIRTDSLTIAKGSLDLTDNRLLVHYSGADPFAQIRAWIFAGKINSSSADKDHSLGYLDSSDNIVPGLAPQTVLVQYTLRGDANLDRRVDFDDLVRLAQHYNDLSGNANWDEGDFTYDGKVDFADLTVLAQHYNMSFAAPAAALAGDQSAARAIAAAPAEKVRPAKPLRPARPIFRVIPAKPRPGHSI